MTHAALTPLLGREFDDFLFAPIGDDQNGPPLSVVSALARLDVDPWKEALSLARMPREEAKERLTAHIASLPNGSTASSVAQGNRGSPDCAVTTGGKAQYGRACDAASSRPRSAFTTIRWARRSRPLGGRLCHLHGASYKCARRHRRCACCDKRTRVSTLGQTTRPGAHRFRRLVVSCPGRPHHFRRPAPHATRSPWKIPVSALTSGVALRLNRV